jgi:hypothetical protein
MPATGRNIGVREASGSVLAFIDSDAYPVEDWLSEIGAAFEEGTRIGGGSLKCPDFQKWKPLALAQYFLQFNEFLGTGARRVKVFVPSVNLFCEKALFEEVGGFPEIRASEDVLFGLGAGKWAPIFFEPTAKVYHIFRENLGAYLRNQEILGKYILIYSRMHYNSWMYRGLMPALLLPAFVAFKFFRIVWRILATGDFAEMGRFLLSLPLFLLGLSYWTLGFLRACFGKESANA